MTGTVCIKHSSGLLKSFNYFDKSGIWSVLIDGELNRSMLLIFRLYFYHNYVYCGAHERVESQMDPEPSPPCKSSSSSQLHPITPPPPPNFYFFKNTIHNLATSNLFKFNSTLSASKCFCVSVYTQPLHVREDSEAPI